MSVHDLLLALMLPSADDAAEDLAYNVGHGSVRRFVGMMNAKARELGLRHTHYSTPIGLDTPGQLLERLGPRQAGRLRPQPFPVLRPDRRSAQRRTPFRQPPALRDQPQHARGRGTLDQRRQDRSHLRRGLRSRRLGAQRRHDAAQRRARSRQRAGPRLQHAGRPQLRLAELRHPHPGARRRGIGQAGGPRSTRRARSAHRRSSVHPRPTPARPGPHGGQGSAPARRSAPRAVGHRRGRWCSPAGDLLPASRSCSPGRCARSAD